MDIFGRKKIQELESLFKVQGLISAKFTDYLNSLNHEARKEYIGQVAGFHPVFKPQLESMMGDQLMVLARIGLTEKEADIIRANINCLRLITEWFDRCRSEYLGNMEETRRQAKSDQEIISRVEQKYL